MNETSCEGSGECNETLKLLSNEPSKHKIQLYCGINEPEYTLGI